MAQKKNTQWTFEVVEKQSRRALRFDKEYRHFQKKAKRLQYAKEVC